MVFKNFVFIGVNLLRWAKQAMYSVPLNYKNGQVKYIAIPAVIVVETARSVTGFKDSNRDLAQLVERHPYKVFRAEFH